MRLFASTMVLLLAVLFFTACKSKSAKELIVNKWTLTEVSGEGAKSLTEAEKKEMVDKFTMKFTGDGKLIMGLSGKTSTNGTYVLSEDGKNLLLTREGYTNTDKLEINELKADKLVITSTTDYIKMSFSAK